MKEEWLLNGAVVPVDVETTSVLVAEIHRLIGVVGGMALAQPKQSTTCGEPVAWMDADGNISDNNDHKCFPIPLYTTPPQRKWVRLTDEERASFDATNPKTQKEWDELFDGIEAKLRSKNT